MSPGQQSHRLMLGFLNEVRSWEGRGVDMTGEDLDVPSKHIRIPEGMIPDYESRYVLKKNYLLEHLGKLKSVTLVDVEATYARYAEEERVGNERRRNRQDAASVLRGPRRTDDEGTNDANPAAG